MSMKKAAGFLFLLSLFCSCSAQTYKIKRAEAFVKVSTPGALMTDDNGNPITPKLIHDRSIYLETNYKGRPQIDSVFYNGVLVVATLGEKGVTVVDVGAKKNNEQPVKLIAKKGHYLWKIDLQPATSEELQPTEKKIIIVKGRLGRFHFRYTINKELELVTEPRY
jgi:hypothetical protein